MTMDEIYSGSSNNLSTQRQYSTHILLQVLQLIRIYASGFFLLSVLVGILTKTRTAIHLYMEALKLKQRLRYTENLRRSLASSINLGQPTKKIGINLEAE